mmetsp:Transcript_90376/g.238383  ORF Transcript_90376/g.238383 Transcript_90376/m.238383 type:complete len:1804 (+) Transcript_90376:3-5414(+)
MNLAALQARVAEATSKVEAVEAAVQEVVGTSKALTATSDADVLQSTSDELQNQQKALMEVQKSLTQDITEARKAGVSATSSVTDLSKLSPRLRSLQMGLTLEVTKLRGFLTRASAGAANVKQQAATSAANKVAEERDSKELQEALPATKEIVNTAEDSVEAIVMMAAPLIADPPDDDGDILNRATEEIELSAADAQTKITEARSQINLKLQGARKFAPETRKIALTEFSSMQQKLTEAQKKLNPYKAFKKEFGQRVQARKALQELSDKLAENELEVEKVKMMTSSAEAGQLTEDEISSAEKVIHPAKAAIENMIRMLEQKLKTSDGPMKDELVQMKDKTTALKKDLDTVVQLLSKQRQSFATAEMLKSASEKVDKADESLKKCQEAEMPFLKGIEVLPGEESVNAIRECEGAAQKAQSAVNQATTFLKTKLQEAKRLVQDLATSVTEELTAHQTRLDAVAKKVADFKKETSERKMAALLSEVIDGVSACEKTMETYAKAAEVFSSESLEAVSSSDLKEALEKSAAAEKEASAAMLEVRKTFAAKQKEARNPDSQQALAKLQARINTAQQELVKTKKAAASGEKMIKGKEVLVEEDEKIKKIEEELTIAEKKVKPGEEEAALGIEEAKVSDEDIEIMAKAFSVGSATLKGSMRVVEANAASAPPSLKTLLQKLMERCKAAQSKITELMAITKDQRERVVSDAFVREGKEKVAQVDACLEKVNEVELPFLKGIEVIALTEAKATIADSETAAEAVQSAVNGARTFIASKNLEIRKFGEAASKPAADEFAQLTERINAASAKLSIFKKDTEGRKKTALMQEAGEKVAAAEVSVKKFAEATAPFVGEDGKEVEGQDEAACEKLVEQMKESASLVGDAATFLTARAKDAAGNPGHVETLKELQAKLKEMQTEMAKHKKVASAHEQKYSAKKVLAEAAETLNMLEEALKTSESTCAPLTEDGGLKFLVGVSVMTLASALRDHMKAKELTHEALYKEFSGGADSLSKDAFSAHLVKLPEALSLEELDFSEERRTAMFAHIDADADGNVSLAEFKGIFKQRFICVKEITVTDGLDVAKSKTTDKISPGVELDTESNPATDESTGMVRIACSYAEGKSGFVTMAGNQGTKFIDLISPFSIFCKEVDKTLGETSGSIMKVSTWFNLKIKELMTAGKEGPLADARGELSKLRSKVTGGNEQLSKLRAKMIAGKKDYAKKEVDEKNAHILARERKEAEAITGPAQAKIDVLEAACKALEEAAKPIVGLTGEELDTFPTPLSVVEACDKHIDEIMKVAEEAKTVAKEQQEKLPKVVKGPMMDAKRELQKMVAKAELSKKQANTTLNAVRGKCGAIIEARAGEVSGLLRKTAQEKGLDAEAYFNVVSPGSEKISEDAFCSYVQSLMGESYKAEQIKLLCQHIEGGGVGRRRFQSFVQQYFAVVKGIAMTDVFDIGAAKTLRKAELEEVVELLEGPRSDDKSGVVRIRGKSLTDGLEGWISLRGNQGTPFLQEVEKPFYSCQVDMALDRDFKSEGEAGLVRGLKADEVLELVEGPRKETYEPGLRVKGKAILDGAIGWFTARDKMGTVFAEADSKYYSCTSSVAMTDNMDIKDCKVVRKLAVGELFTVEEGPIKVEDAGITRVKGKSVKDDAIGWITLKGNAGTVYAEASSKHFCILQDVPMTKLFPSAAPGEEVRVLAKGEAMQVLEGPKQETYLAETRVKCKAASDGAAGWITLKKDNTKPWTPYYKCKAAAPMHDAAAAEGATVVREIEVAEVFELLEGPTAEGDVLRMKGRAEKDGSVGWVTIKDGAGKRFFES